MLQSNIHKETLPVNDESNADMIYLDSSDPTSHYTIVPNALIRDETISPNCRWLIIYLISNKPGWSIKSSQLCHHTKGFCGRDKIRTLLNEAIEAGYIERKDVLKSAAKGGYFRRCYYTVSSTPKFKKTLPGPEIQGPGFAGPENQGDYSLLSLRKEEEEEKNFPKPEPAREEPKEAEEESSIDEAEKDYYERICKDHHYDWISDNDKMEVLEKYGGEIVSSVFDSFFVKFPSLKKGKVPASLSSPIAVFITECKKLKRRKDGKE